jgi:acylphosphatase
MPEPLDEFSVIARRLTVRGRVQGVSYRASAQAEAMRLGLRGWVRNRLDGTVEALVHGPGSDVERFIAWTRQGPPGALVQGVEVVEVAVEVAEAGSFSIWRTV